MYVTPSRFLFLTNAFVPQLRFIFICSRPRGIKN
ncbi:hypothetical protein, unlikely [Trypanosoma brucei brucei TREU927]|uniref:Uncharacterized protein n=1 Tax=Trypanosoma brucei brucei (strain 927/4 GUTat10.1) TaxID=185431 RepID=Q38F26_TRYB2|nr:hypothetical protein, unlikely [Trypanosoma brucei brucei TREU927]EAN76594.1 hypothetical protein, unlikely [Trypanosoma brucei brucei TREU927]